ncbi:orotate phosphoribosyltransferase [Dethiobacter alkaliphilus]|uniref:orotate phosphoribosyltransferase n=1 Tax=Dethiobacter alkaliphilus TaxID=427926 RepID=UPI002226CDC9|nr:orotate phosphoribosyltransferase [Dethiobacter alkaliphilus]MCW3491401.1 orotate phosphoribosyltransferase [Dethiobacter alkaliphilus]
MLTRERVLEIFKKADVLLEGHFQLTSGRHSNRYLQCARVFQYPEFAEELCAALAKQFEDKDVDVVVGPALGGVVMAYETARAMKTRGLFVERDKEGTMTLRRGFVIQPGERVLVVEDVVTTGGSVREAIEVIKDLGGEVIGVGSIVDRSAGQADFGAPYASLIQVDVESFDPTDCPLCKEGTPAVKPGSRK